MAYSESVLSRATARLEKRRKAHRAQREALRREVLTKLPRAGELDRQLSRTLPQIIAAALRQGEDPQEAIRLLKEKNLSQQRELKDVLTQNGYPADALDEVPFCPLCRDTGWRGARMCACLRELCTQEQIQELSSRLDFMEQSFPRFRLDFYDTETVPAYGRSPRQNMERVYALCQNYAEKFGAFPFKNLFLHGGTGLGKTFLSACIAKEVSQRGFSVVYDTAGNIFARFEEKKFSRDIENVQEARDVTRKYLRCDLLILDDLGSELTTPFVQSALYQLLNTRLTSGRATVISSNLSMDDVKRRYTPQIASRLEGEYRSLFFFGSDIRLKKTTLPR